MISWFFRNEVQISGFPQYFQSIHPEFILLKDVFCCQRHSHLYPGLLAQEESAWKILIVL